MDAPEAKQLRDPPCQLPGVNRRVDCGARTPAAYARTVSSKSASPPQPPKGVAAACHAGPCKWCRRGKPRTLGDPPPATQWASPEAAAYTSRHSDGVGRCTRQRETGGSTELLLGSRPSGRSLR